MSGAHTSVWQPSMMTIERLESHSMVRQQDCARTGLRRARTAARSALDAGQARRCIRSLGVAPSWAARLGAPPARARAPAARAGCGRPRGSRRGCGPPRRRSRATGPGSAGCTCPGPGRAAAPAGTRGAAARASRQGALGRRAVSGRRARGARCLAGARPHALGPRTGRCAADTSFVCRRAWCPADARPHALGPRTGRCAADTSFMCRSWSEGCLSCTSRLGTAQASSVGRAHARAGKTQFSRPLQPGTEPLLAVQGQSGAGSHAGSQRSGRPRVQARASHADSKSNPQQAPGWQRW